MTCAGNIPVGIGPAEWQLFVDNHDDDIRIAQLQASETDHPTMLT